MNILNCIDCKYFFQMTEGIVGECHANPPTVVVIESIPRDMRPTVARGDTPCRFFVELEGGE